VGRRCRAWTPSRRIQRFLFLGRGLAEAGRFFYFLLLLFLRGTAPLFPHPLPREASDTDCRTNFILKTANRRVATPPRGGLPDPFMAFCVPLFLRSPIGRTPAPGSSLTVLFLVGSCSGRVSGLRLALAAILPTLSAFAPSS